MCRSWQYNIVLIIIIIFDFYHSKRLEVQYKVQTVPVNVTIIPQKKDACPHESYLYVLKVVAVIAGIV